MLIFGTHFARWMVAATALAISVLLVWTEERRRRTRFQNEIIREFLRRVEGQHRNARLEKENDCACLIDLSGRLTLESQAVRKIVDYPPDERIDFDLYQLAPPVQHEFVAKMIEDTVLGKAAGRYNFSVRTRDGRRVALEVSTRLIDVVH
jgi:PAS domain S-box-containing protein